KSSPSSRTWRPAAPPSSSSPTRSVSPARSPTGSSSSTAERSSSKDRPTRSSTSHSTNGPGTSSARSSEPHSHVPLQKPALPPSAALNTEPRNSHAHSQPSRQNRSRPTAGTVLASLAGGLAACGGDSDAATTSGSAAAGTVTVGA